MNKKRIIVCTVTVAFSTGFLLLNFLAYNHAHNMLNFTDESQHNQKPLFQIKNKKLQNLFFGSENPRPITNIKISEEKPLAQEITIRCSNGVTLSAWHINCLQSDKLVILFHGYGKERSSLLTEAEAFHDLGLSSLLVDFRGSGASSEAYTSIGYFEAEDVLETVRYTQKNLRYTTTILFGQSMGATAILKALHDEKIAVNGIILEGVFDTLLNTVKNRFNIMGVPSFPNAELLVLWGSIQMGFNGFAHNPVEYSKHIDTPALVMHGTDDPKALLKGAEEVFSQLQGPKKFKKFLNAKHEAYTERYPTEWKLSVKDFLTTIN